jgi:hypothetical protein
MAVRTLESPSRGELFNSVLIMPWKMNLIRVQQSYQLIHVKRVNFCFWILLFKYFPNIMSRVCRQNFIINRKIQNTGNP